MAEVAKEVGDGLGLTSEQAAIVAERGRDVMVTGGGWQR